MVGGKKGMKQLTAKVAGRVQGVSFRYYTQLEAKRLGLTGWVRNERDGSVTVVAEGTEERVVALLDYLKHGPRAARVESVKTRWSQASREYQSFEVRWI